MSTASFPSSIVTWTDKKDGIDDVNAEDMNNAYAEIIATETMVKSHDSQLADIMNRQLISLPLTSPLTPSQLNFTLKKDFRKISIIDENFIDVNDDFLVDTSNLYAINSLKGTATAQISNNTFNVVGTTFEEYICHNSEIKIPYCVSSAIFSTFSEIIAVGFLKDTSNWMLVKYNKNTKELYLELNVSGTITKLTYGTMQIDACTTIYAVLNAKFLNIMLDDGTGVKFIKSFNIFSYFDFLSVSELKSWRYCFGGVCVSSAYVNSVNVTNTFVVNKFKCGLFGYVGIRDMAYVKFVDGTPYIKDNKAFLTVTSGGMSTPSNIDFIHSHQTIWEIDISTYEMKCIGHILWEKDGRFYNNHPMQILYDSNSNKFILGLTTYWGNSLNYKTVDCDILHGLHILSDCQLLKLSTEGDTPSNKWDVDFCKINGLWYATWTAVWDSSSGGYTSYLAKGSDLSNLTLIGRSTQTEHNHEGTRLLKIGGTWYVANSGGSDGNQYFDLSMNYLGMLNVPMCGKAVNEHPCIIPICENEKTRFVFITFDFSRYYDTTMLDSRGHTFILEAGETEDGYEFPIRFNTR